MVTYTAEYRAHFSDTDAAGIVHFSTIFFWVECDYLAPIYREDVVKLTLTPAEIGDKKLVWLFDAHVGERAVAKGKLTTVYAWRDGQGPMSAALVPLEIKQALQRHFGEV